MKNETFNIKYLLTPCVSASSVHQLALDPEIEGP